MKALQAALTVMGALITVTALLDMAFGVVVVPGNPGTTPSLDSQYRFLSAMWLMAGLALLSIVTKVRTATTTTTLRMVCGAVFLGGLARIVSLIAVGPPHPLLIAYTAIELVAPPVLIWWQNAVAQRPVSQVV